VLIAFNNISVFMISTARSFLGSLQPTRKFFKQLSSQRVVDELATWNVHWWEHSETMGNPAIKWESWSDTYNQWCIKSTPPSKRAKRNWLVVLTIWKIWVRQCEGWHPICEMENKKCLKPRTRQTWSGQLKFGLVQNWSTKIHWWTIMFACKKKR